MSFADTQPLTSAPVPAPSYPAVVGPTAANTWVRVALDTTW